MHATTVAIDLAKEVFELAFADDGGHIVERKRLSRRAFAVVDRINSRPRKRHNYRTPKELFNGA